ncbi:MAG: hypothetical protein M3415_02950, partial [Actinomycetota bacterium]|nr:hypothetical protein [Actinomycetota bacterium]
MQPGWEGVDSRRPRWVPALLIAAVVAVGVASAVALAVGSRDAPARDLRVETGDATRPRPPSSSSDSARAQDQFAAGPLGAGWQALPPSPLPAREDHTAVWTGGEVVFWGGNALAGRNRVRADGAAWDPRERRWRDIRPASGPG